MAKQAQDVRRNRSRDSDERASRPEIPFEEAVKALLQTPSEPVDKGDDA